jgi:hypothetical protein
MQRVRVAIEEAKSYNATVELALGVNHASMSIPVLHGLSSPDLDRSGRPADPRSCAITVNAEIGPSASGGAEGFSFVAVTPDQLLDAGLMRWGRGYLILQEFSWDAVETAVRKLLMHADRPKWEDSARELAKEMNWEFDAYSKFLPR